jgi:hypothetical protein
MREKVLFFTLKLSLLLELRPAITSRDPCNSLYLMGLRSAIASRDPVEGDSQAQKAGSTLFRRCFLFPRILTKTSFCG